jgi:transposase
MFIRVKEKTNGAKSVQIVESFRFRERVSQKIVQHIGIANNDDELNELKRLASEILKQLKNERKFVRGQKELFGDNPESDATAYDPGIERVLTEDDDVRLASLVNDCRVIDGPFEVVEWAFQNMGLNRIFTNKKRDGARVKVLKQCIAGMMASPGSKMGISSWLAKYYADSASLDSIYRFMDDFYKKKNRVMEVVRCNSESISGDRVNLMLYDVTTLYFESFEEDELRQCGYSKDNKFKETQVVLALATTADGLPIWYETYPGKTWEGNTFKEFVQKWKTTALPGVEGVVVADCGMFSDCNLSELKENGLHYALGAPLKKLPEIQKQAVLDLASYKEIECGDSEQNEKIKYTVIKRPDGSNVLSTWSAKRANKNYFDRRKLIDRVLKKLSNGKKNKGKIKGEELIGNRGAKKYIKLEEGQEQNTYVLDEEKIERDARWDGFRGVITDLPLDTAHDVKEVLSHYGSLWKIEESFRISKTDLKIRPVYHWTKKRIEAHILLCYLVFACLRYLERRTYLQQHVRMSPGMLREAMFDVDSSIFKDPENGRYYRIPRVLTPLAQKLYRCLGIKRDTKPRELLNISAYYRREQLLEKSLEAK